MSGDCTDTGYCLSHPLLGSSGVEHGSPARNTVSYARSHVAIISIGNLDFSKT